MDKFEATAMTNGREMEFAAVKRTDGKYNVYVNGVLIPSEILTDFKAACDFARGFINAVTAINSVI